MSQPTHSASSLAALQRASDERSLRVPELPLDQIDPDPAQPRKELSQEELEPEVKKDLDGLAANIRAIGVVQPIRVRPKPEGEGYWVVAGERRFHAAKLAGLDRIPAIIDLEDRQAEARLVLQISENLQRSDLRLLDLARGLDKLRKTSDLNHSQLATMLGRSKTWFSHHLRALRARGIPLEALEENLIQSAETLRLFQKLPEAQQQRLLNAARDAEAPIPRSQVRGLLKRRKNAEEAAVARRGPKLYGLRLSADELRRLIGALGSEAPEEDQELADILRELLKPAEARS